MIYLNANRSAAYRWDGRAHQFEFFFFGGAGRWVKSDLLTGLFRKEAGSPEPESWLERYAEDEGWQSVSDADFVRLRPFRTFLEVEQPESEFLLLVDADKGIGLFEADGGVWKLEAKRNIADYFASHLADLIDAGQVVVMQ